MDINKQKLKSRLNVKFQPLQHHRYSFKKNQNLQLRPKKLQKKEQQQSMVMKNRSLSHVKLPSLDKRQQQKKQDKKSLSKYDKLDKSQHSSHSLLPQDHIASTKDETKKLNDHIKLGSQKNIPKIKIDTKEPINKTITYLLHKQILTIPKIVALLKQTNSDEFLYLKIIDMYEYQVCEQEQKGQHYATVSKNGMIVNGRLIPLKDLVRQFDIYKKLKKIHLFKYYTLIRSLNRWKQGSLRAKFKQTQKYLTKQLFLADSSYIKYKIELNQILAKSRKRGGWISSTWVQNYVKQYVEQNKSILMNRLIQICFQMLQKFQLPISASPELMNRVLGNLSSLNMSFEKKIMIQRQVVKFFKLARQLEMNFLKNTGFFIKDHLEELIKKVNETKKNYTSAILQNLEQLSLNNQKFISERDKILINSPAVFDINFTLYLDKQQHILNIKPSPIDIFYQNTGKIKQFIKKAQEINFNFLKTQEFAFVLNIVYKGNVPSFFIDQDETKNMFRNYVLSIEKYKTLNQNLRYAYQQLDQIFIRRIRLLQPFLIMYYQYDRDPPVYDEPQYSQIQAQKDKIERTFCFLEKLHEGEYFLFGYLNFENFKKQLKDVLVQYEQAFQKRIPKLLHNHIKILSSKFQTHKAKLTAFQNTPQSFILVSEQCEALQQNTSYYTETLHQLEKIQQLYKGMINRSDGPTDQQQYKSNLKSIGVLKRQLNQLKTQIKDFNRQKDDRFIMFKKILEQNKVKILHQIESKYGNISNQEQVKHVEIYEKITIQKLQQNYKTNQNKKSQTSLYSNIKINSYQLYKQQMNKAEVIVNRVQSGLTNLKRIDNQIQHLNNLQNYFTIRVTFVQYLPIQIFLYENLLSIWTIYVNIFKIQIQAWNRQLKELVNSQDILKECESYLVKLQKILKDNSSVHYEDLIRYLKNKIYEIFANFQFISEVNSNHLRAQDLQQINYLLERNLQNQNTDNKSANSLNDDRRKSSSVSSEISLKRKETVIKCRQITYMFVKQSNIKRFKLDISQICFKARKQIQILESISKFQQWFKSIKLEYQPLQNYPYIPIFTQNFKLRTQIQDYSVILLNILNNKYSKQTRKICNQLLNQVSNLTDLLELTINHQQKFLSLYPILTSKYAQSQLSVEFKKFDGILKKSMKNVKLVIRPTQNLTVSLKSILTNNIKAFDQSQKVLQKFLQKKRLKFQRFYFLQDDQLLEVLVGISSERQIFRMFDGIRGWVYNQDKIKVGVEGFGGQKLLLKGWVYKNSEPETIFKNLEDAIKNNLNSLVRNSLHLYQFQMKELRQIYDQNNIPWMCRYAIEMILFCKQIQINCFIDHIDITAITNLLQQSINKISLRIKKNNSQQDGIQNINKIITSSNHITLLLYLLHFTQQIRNSGNASYFNFQWQSFQRYYYQKDSVKMRALGSQHTWGGQYQGLWSLMVNTSDIRRAHTCVLTNIKHGNGVLLQGPSGTGKTQSLKELARCMGKYCVIFNCSNNVKINTLQKILSGLCYTASWLCLDEINRLTIDIMSVIANQIISIRNAVVAKRQSFMFGNKEIKLHAGVGIFSTMNPIYLKRARLTENIKSYFRVITVTIPEYQKILQILLYSLQFQKPYDLAKKIGSFFKNLSIQLGEYSQYDFGLRAMKFFVNSMSKQKTIAQEQNQIISQTQIIEKGLHQTFSFRLDPTDIPKFTKIVQDSFHITLKTQKIISFNQKIHTIKQCSQTGIIVFGPLSCKTHLIKQYCSTLQQPQILQFNPNAVNIKHFLGESIHGKWQHGIVQKMAKSSLQNINKDHIIILDSTIKSQIIQSFNTLLDQSRILSLSNGTRLKIKENFKMIMETPHLNLSSPATVTRCNLIYVCSEDVNKHELILQQLPNSLKNIIIGQQITVKIAKARKAQKRIIEFYQKFSLNEIRNIGKLAYLLLSEKIINFDGQWSQNQILAIQKTITFSARILGVSDKIKDLINKENSFSLKKSPFDFTLSFKKYSQGQFIQITKKFQPVKLFNQLVIKTAQTQFCQWLNRRSITKPYSCLCWQGKRLSGKTTMIELSLQEYNKLKRIKIPITPQISSQKFIQYFYGKPYQNDQNLEQSTRNAEQIGKIILLIEDLHLGKQQVIEQTRFMIEKRKFFDVNSKENTKILPFSIFTQLTTNQQNNNEISRLMRHFCQVKIPQIDSFIMKSIYQEYIRSALAQTDTTQMFKSVAQIEIQRLSIFLLEYKQIKKQYFKQFKNTVNEGNFELIKIIQNIGKMTGQNAKQGSDFIQIMFYYLRLHQENSQKQNYYPQSLKQAYFKVYKEKYQIQFERHFKSINNIDNRHIFTQFKNAQGINKFYPIKQLKDYVKSELQKKIANLYLSDCLLESIISFITNVIEDKRVRGCFLNGPSGYGKKTIVKLACKAVINCNMVTFSYPKNIHISSNGSKQQDQYLSKFYFNLLKSSFEKKITTCVILNIQKQQHQRFLYLVNCTLTGTPVTNLFASDETDYMFSTISDFIGFVYQKSSKTYDQICDDYVYYASRNIKCIITSQKQQKIKYIKKFPYIQKALVIQKLEQYPLQSIYRTGQQILNKILIGNTGKQKQKTQISHIPPNLSNIFLKIYNIFKHYVGKKKDGNNFYNHLTHFKLVNFFATHYKQSNRRIKVEEDTILRSIQKVHQIQSILSKLRQQQAQIQPQIANKKQELSNILPSLEKIRQVVQDTKRDLDLMAKQIQFLQQQLKQKNNQIDKQIQKSKPLLNEAQQCLVTVKRSDISQLKNNNNPHPLVKFTLQNLTIVLGQKQSDQSIKRMLSDPNFMLRLKQTQNIAEQNYQKLKKRIEVNPEWTIESVSKISYGIRYIVKYIKNLVEHLHSKEKVQELKQVYQKMNNNTKRIRQQYEIQVNKYQIKVKQLSQKQRQYENIKKSLNGFQQKVSQSQKRYKNAENIAKILFSKIDKWNERLEYYQQIKKSSEMYNIMLALFLLVFPYITQYLQNQIVFEIKKVAVTQSLYYMTKVNLIQDVKNFLLDKTIVNKLSHQEAINPKLIQYLYHMNQIPLLLDPDNQVQKWLGNFHKSQSCEVVYTKQNFMGASKIVEQAMREGNFLVILTQNGVINNFISQIITIRRKTETNKGRQLVQYNKTMFYIQQNFKLLLTCKSRSPDIPISTFLEHQVIDFQITAQTLRQRLLSEVLKYQNPSLFMQKISQQSLVLKNMLSLQQMEEKILAALINNKKSIVDDQQFIKVLNQSYNKTQYLKQNRKYQIQSLKDVQNYVKSFDHICNEAVKIYMSLKHMDKLNKVLVWNVQIFTKSFIQACQESIKVISNDDHSSNEDYIQNTQIIDDTEYQNFQYVAARPSSAFSMMSAATSRYASENLQQSRQKVSVQGQQKQIHQSKQNKKNFALENLLHKDLKDYDESQRGKIDPLRYSKIVSHLIDILKTGFDEDQKKIWALTFMLGQYKQQNIKVLFCVYQQFILQNKNRMSEKEWKINQLFELNITTQNIQKYFSGLQPQNMDIQGNKILADKDNLLLGKYSQYLNIVDILILTLVLQPKKFIVYVQNFIKSQGLGCIFQNSQFNFQEILRNSDSVHPILFLMGEDPLSRITDFFTKKKIKNIIIISMGEGQQSLAETVLERQWMKQTMVIIHNIHICPSIFPLLTKTIEQFSFSGYNRQPHKNFRLILISENVETLPSQLVGSCQKYLIGQPGGINKRMISLYTKIAKKHIDLRKQQDLNRIVYSLCLLHSLINQIDNYPPYGWNLKYNFTIQDFIHGIKTIKEIHGQSNISQDSNSEYLRCNIEIQQLKKMKKNTIDLQSLKYGVGEINYLGKIADQMDKQKMLTLIDRHFSQAFLYNKQNVQGKWSFKIPQNQNQTYIEISKLQQKNPVMFDLHESIQHRQEIPKYYLGYISQLFLRDKRNTDAESEALGKSQYKQIENLNELENIEHKISFINQSFTEFNEKIVDIKKNIGNINRKVYQKTLEHYKLLSSISSQSNSFSLKSFNSPRKLFSSIKMDMAAKLKVQFQSISIMWSVGINLGKGQNVYAITDIKLQGANINNGILIDGKQQTGLVLYFWPIHLKKNKAQIISNKYKVKIPLYFKQQRSGRINSFGENTNLLTMIGIESKERQQFWTLRSTAFVADYK